MNSRLVVVLGFVCGLGVIASGAENNHPAPKLTQAPKIDGVLADGEWKEALYLADFIDQPTGQKPAERTEAWIGVDKEGIHVAIYAHDSQPDQIIARTVQKGGELDEDDYAGLIIDPLNRRAMTGNSQFFVNPIGTQYENIAGGRAAKKEWRGTWFSATTRVTDGYIIEMMVPWKLLSYPGGQSGDILFNIGRVHQRTKEVSYASDMGRPFRQENHLLMTGVEFPKRSIADQIDLLGYISPEYDEDENPSTSVRGGMDIRYRPTETLNAVLSVSPDFKNIEGEVEGIGFTRTERFLEDTRPFFTEGAQYFNLSSQYGVGRAFYSQRIDDFDQGFKFFGDFDKRQSIGVLAAREDGNRLDSVFRYRYLVNPRNSFSVFGTYRDEPGRKNSVIGGSGIIGSGNHELGVELMNSDDGGQPGMAGRFYFDYDIPNYFASINGMFIQPEFRARLGLIPFVDRSGGYFFQEYNKDFRQGAIRSVHIENFVEAQRHMDGTNAQRTFEIGGNFETRDDMRFTAFYVKERYDDEDAEEFQIGAGWNVSNRFKQLSLDYNWGHIGGVDTSYFSLGGQFRIGKGLDLGFEQTVFKLAGKREQSIISLGWEIDAEQSLTGRYVKTDQDSNWYVAYRRSGGLGLEYFVILGDPNADTFRNRAAFKVVWAR